MRIELSAWTLVTSDNANWRQFLRAFAVSFVTVVAGASALVLVVDPYDSGRFGVAWSVGVVDVAQRTATVSLGRDPQFDAAIIGNSTVQLVDPRRLAPAGVRFVQLSVPGTGPAEQTTVLRYFIRHHRRIRAVVLGADMSWCGQDPDPPLTNPFPFWLYGDDRSYLANVLNVQSVSRVWRRVLLAAGLRRRTDPAGYSDYEIGRTWSFRPTVAAGFVPTSGDEEMVRLAFPAIDRLASMMADLPAETRFVVAMMPVFYGTLPEAGSAQARLVSACKAAFARFARGRAGATFVDFAVDGPLARAPENFMDALHYRSNVARQIEARIAAELEMPTLAAGGE